MMNQKFAMCQKQLFESVLLHLLLVIAFTIVTLLFSIYHLQYNFADCLVLLLYLRCISTVLKRGCELDT